MESVDLDDLEDFVRRAEEVERQVRAIASSSSTDGTSSVPAASTTGSSEEEVQARAAERANAARWAAQAAERRAREEQEKWWAFAYMQYPDMRDREARIRVSCPRVITHPQPEPAVTVEAAPATPAAPVKHYTGSDYSKWEKWQPDDPVSKEESERVAREAEEAKDKAFEAANPDFVAMFKSDMEKRNDAERVRAARAEKLKERGNAAFKERRYDACVDLYTHALELSPWHAGVLNNMCQAYLSKSEAEPDTLQAVEFATRCLVLEEGNVKARYRRALALMRLAAWDDAMRDLEAAARMDPANADVTKMLATARLEAAEAVKEKSVPLSTATAADDATARMHARIHELLVPVKDAVDAPRLIPWTSLQLRDIAAALTDDAYRMLMRLSGALQLVADAFVRTCDALASRSALTPAVYLHPSALPAAGLLLAATCDNPKNRLLVSEAGCVRAAAAALSAPDDHLIARCNLLFKLPRLGDVSSKIPVSMTYTLYVPAFVSSLMAVLDVYARHGDAVPARDDMLRSPYFASKPADASAQTISTRLLACADSIGSGHAVPADVFEAAAACASTLQHLALAVIGKHDAHAALLLPACAGEHGALAMLIRLMIALTSRSLVDASVLTSYAMQATIGALANLVHAPELRTVFLQRRGGKDAVEPAVAFMKLLTIPSSLLWPTGPPPGAVGEWDTIRASLLATLANVIVGNVDSMELLARAQAVVLLLSVLERTAAVGMASSPAASEVVQARAALLLGRLSPAPSALKVLRTPDSMRALLRLIQRCATADVSTPEAGQYVDGLVRALAAASADSALPETLEAFDDGALSTITTILISSCGLVKRGDASRMMTVGNLCKVAAVLAMQESRHSRVLDAGMCDALVTALKCANSGSGAHATSALRNAASALARLTRTPACNERIRELRGVEILMQLSKSLT